MTSATPDPPSNTAPGWPYCGPGAAAQDPASCRGRRVPGYSVCLAHLAEADRAAYLAALTPGADIDHRGTTFTKEVLNRLLNALRDPATGRPRLGDARFGGAAFTGDADFGGAAFTGTARFGGATFTGDAVFGGANFGRDTVFGGATFTGGAGFGGATFTGDAQFDKATFTGVAEFHKAAFLGDAGFGGATFTGDAHFAEATFTGDARFSETRFTRDARFAGSTFTFGAWFGGVTFTGDAQFVGATFAAGAWFAGAAFTGDARFVGATFTNNACFERARFAEVARLGPLVCGDTVALDGALFGEPVTVEMAARVVTCDRTQWASTATLRLRYAELDLSDAVLEYPLTVTAHPRPFARPRGGLLETPLSGSDPSVRLTSVGGVDAAHLVLNDIDLSTCRFAGAVHLDQLRVDGRCTFATTPTGVQRRWPLPRWWTLRRTLVEEHHWRARRPPRAMARGWYERRRHGAARLRDERMLLVAYVHPVAARGWTLPPPDTPALKPAALAALYRQVRKSLEDGKNEPDAADFYYGECEMRRHDTTRSGGERALLTAYWMLSGYGLRAGRALVWLLGAMAVTLLTLLLWGLPVDDPKPTTTGRQVAVGQEVTWTTDTPDPVNPTGPWPERVTTERFEKALRVVINSVVFRSSGQDLTTAGTYTEMSSRLAEPVLLGLAVLAIRSRVKR
ncbi:MULTISPECIES: pentapeptide repeat-containing protein [Streptomyces]|uniref:Pentapeptide repeat-containing protein n=2 Tax=Streptomyces TaxID=1883 RepID=A0A3M8F9K1_9ACTN|nr:MULTISPECIES: pentapeptide repeat-containing protein [Streptomyces]KNE80415.1 hypothetical protein ADZ36_22250 [Streptomyces fradiae]PQM22596.1 metal transporter [Streptomyces xinghaiensis]RKM96438.1 pentapeptide repeat-containing protein [Streptomyces xinghaiensis]RNC74411.1 pentapeptide repeat-containing protein [Streptomyces xinghaiensis]